MLKMIRLTVLIKSTQKFMKYQGNTLKQMKKQKNNK